MSERTDILKDHAYDGIQEYDNPTPGWWTWSFVATILFSIVYYFFVTLAGGQLSPSGEYDRAVVADLKKQGGALTGDAKTLVRLMKDDDSLRAGANIFAANCVACHGRDGSGVLGPNLTDDYYINVKKIEDICIVIKQGRNNGAMPAWGNRLSGNEIVLAGSYVASLRGKNLTGKPHEGQAIAPWSAE